MAAPTIVAGPLKSAFNTTTQPKTAGSFTWSVGDLFIIVSLNENDGASGGDHLPALTGGPTGTLIKERQQGVNTGGGTQPTMTIWSIIATNASSGSFSCSHVGGGGVVIQYGVIAYQFAAGATVGASNVGAGTTKTLSITTTGDNSYVIFAVGDWSVGATPTVWTPTGHTSDEANTSAAYTWDVEHWTNQAPATTSYGVTTGLSAGGPLSKGVIEVIGPTSSAVDSAPFRGQIPTFWTPQGFNQFLGTAFALRGDMDAVPALTLALTPVDVPVTAVALAVTPGGVSPAETPATVTVAAQALGVTPGGVSLALTPATVVVTPQALTASAAVSLAVTPASIPVVAQTLTSVPGATTAALTPATVVVTAQALTAVPAVSLALAPASIPVTGQALGITIGQSVALSPASIPVTAQALGTTVGGASAALTPATIPVTAQTLTVTPGGNSLTLTPVTIPVIAQALTATAAVSLGLTPPSVPVVAQALTVTAVATVVLAPAIVNISANPLAISNVGGSDQFLGLLPATVDIQAQPFGITQGAGTTPTVVTSPPGGRKTFEPSRETQDYWEKERRRIAAEGPLNAILNDDEEVLVIM
jgi:hypothetical protein